MATADVQSMHVLSLLCVCSFSLFRYKRATRSIAYSLFVEHEADHLVYLLASTYIDATNTEQYLHNKRATLSSNNSYQYR